MSQLPELEHHSLKAQFTRKLNWRQVGGLLLQSAVGGVFGAALAHAVLRGGALLPADAPKGWALLLAFVGLILAFPLQVLVHELGHALLGVRNGGTLLRVVVGPWRWERRRSGFYYSKVRSLKGIGGFAQTVMPADARFRRAMSWMLLGGPLANLASAALAIALLLAPAPWPIQMLALGTAVVGLMLGLANLVPFAIKGFLSDGAHLKNLWTRPEIVARQQRTMRLARASLDGVRVRDLDAEDLAALDPAGLQGAERFSGVLLHAAVHADRGEVASARALIELGLSEWDQYPDGFRQSLALLAAGLAAHTDRDPVRARELLARTEGGLLEPFQTALVEAQIAHLEGNVAARAAAMERVRAALADTLYRGDVPVIMEALAALEAEVTTEANRDTSAPERKRLHAA